MFILFTYFQNQQKKNVILSGEAMKEMQKQAKANRDERRQQVSFQFKKKIP